jgi:hypothetical protein
MGGDSLPGREPSRAERQPLERQRPNVKLKLLRLATLAAVTVLAAVAAATAGAPPPSRVFGHIYVNDNTAVVNTIAAFDRHADGTLTPMPGSPFVAGGVGAGEGLASQGSLQLSSDVAEQAQLVDKAELDRRRGQAGAADRDALVGRVERRSSLLGHRRFGEPGVALDAVECAAEDDLRDRAPDVGERGPELVSRSDGSVSHTNIVS